MYKFWLRFHWSLFPKVQLTIFQHWLRQWLGAVQVTSHLSEPKMVSSYICVTRPQWVDLLWKHHLCFKELYYYVWGLIYIRLVFYQTVFVRHFSDVFMYPVTDRFIHSNFDLLILFKMNSWSSLSNRIGLMWVSWGKCWKDWGESGPLLCSLWPNGTFSVHSLSILPSIHIHFRLRCCLCPILWGWQHKALSNTGSPCISVKWINAS